MKSKNGYIIYTLITIAIMAIALFVPSLRLPGAEASIPLPATASNSAYTSDNKDETTSNTDFIEKEGSSLSYLEKIQAVGATIAKIDGYAREKIENSNPDKAEASEQFAQIIQRLYENGFLDETIYSELLKFESDQAVTEYSYTKDSNPLFIVRILDRTYYNVSICSKIAISVGLDRESGGVIYLYLNFYGLYDDKFDIDTMLTDKYLQTWPLVLGFSPEFNSDYSNELNTSDGLRVHAEYKLDDSSTIYYKFGFSYEIREDRYQIFMQPAAG